MNDGGPRRSSGKAVTVPTPAGLHGAPRSSRLRGDAHLDTPRSGTCTATATATANGGDSQRRARSRPASAAEPRSRYAHRRHTAPAAAFASQSSPRLREGRSAVEHKGQSATRCDCLHSRARARFTLWESDCRSACVAGGGLPVAVILRSPRRPPGRGPSPQADVPGARTARGETRHETAQSALQLLPQNGHERGVNARAPSPVSCFMRM